VDDPWLSNGVKVRKYFGSQMGWISTGIRRCICRHRHVHLLLGSGRGTRQQRSGILRKVVLG